MNTTPRGAIEAAGDTPNAPTGRQYFLGIGVDTYEHFPSLANAGKDVDDICAALCEHYYFERADTALLKGPAANRRNILRQLDAYRRNLTPNDRLLIYYAGHGLFDGGLGFWVPAEAERDEISTYIGNAEVREILRNTPARHILLISDSCFSASLLVRDANRDARAFEDFERNPSRWVFISGKGVVSDGKPGQNSPFAAGILKHLRQNTEKALNIAHLADRVTKEVRFNYEQQAEATPLYQAGHEGGQFVFRRRQVEADAWATALAANTEGSLLHYLHQYPHGQFAAEADRCLADIADARAWAKASQQDAAFAYRNYLRDYQQGQHAAEARAKLDGFLADYHMPTPQPVPTVPNWLAFVKGSTFTMGDAMGDNLRTDETPHSVTVADFYISKYEVTFDDYDAFCTATEREKTSDSGWGRGQRPVINVSWYDAIEYCNWRSNKDGLQACYAIDKNTKDPNNQNTSDTQKWSITCDWTKNGYRLPTEAEWEYAAREGGKKVRFGNGRDVIDPSEVNFDASSKYKKSFSIVGEYRQKTVPVNQLSHNALGLYHMSGNVLEWCWDWYDASYYAESDGARQPRGASWGQCRVVRGGSWNYNPVVCRAAFRLNGSPNLRYYVLGFRVVRHL